MSFDEACARGAGDEATEEGEVIPPTQEDVAMPPGEDTEEGEGMPPTHEDVDMPPEDDTEEREGMPPTQEDGQYASRGRYCS